MCSNIVYKAFYLHNCLISNIAQVAELVDALD